MPGTTETLHRCGVKPTVSEKSQFSKQPCGVDATMIRNILKGEMLILQD